MVVITCKGTHTHMHTHTHTLSMTHCGVHNTSVMSPNGVGYVTNVDSVEVLAVRGTLNKDLVHQTVAMNDKSPTKGSD